MLIIQSTTFDSHPQTHLPNRFQIKFKIEGKGSDCCFGQCNQNMVDDATDERFQIQSK